jgi:hypothetical protein
MQAPDTGRSDPPPGDLPPELVREMDRDALSRLVREVNAQGVSFQQMSDRAASAGHDLSKPYFQKLATNSVTTAPTPARLSAIAAGLSKPLRIVTQAAAIQFLNYEATELAGYDEETRVIVAHLAGMPPKERRRWRRMIEVSDADEGDDL